MTMYSLFKRIFDIFSSLLAIIVLSPIFLISGILIVVFDPGPVFYMAKRVGKDNRIFRMYKFRSMRVDRNANEKNFKADTNRIFPWGKFIRRSKIDELPQLFNVLLGDMSIVGPRPASVDQIDVVRSGQNAIVSSVKPGLSGPAALYDYLYGDKIEDENEYKKKVLPIRMELDIIYTKNISFIYDAKIIIYTIISIFNTICGRESKKILLELCGCTKEIKED